MISCMKRESKALIAVLILLAVGLIAWRMIEGSRANEQVEQAQRAEESSRDTNAPDADNDGVADADEGRGHEAEDSNANGVDDRSEDSAPVVSASGNIRVTSPDTHQLVGEHGLVLVGEARVFESAFSWRVKDAAGEVLASGHDVATASDIGQFGPFVVYATYDATPDEDGSVEVFSYSARDGAEQDMVTIPVTFAAESLSEVYLTNHGRASEQEECSEVFGADRWVIDSNVPAIRLHDALWELLAGPTTAEAARSWASTIPSGVRVNSLLVNDSDAVVTVDFSSEIDTGGACSVQSIRAQVEHTVAEIMGDDYSVVITVDGGSPDEALQP